VRLESGGVAKLIGMVHLLPLPGSAGWAGDRRAVLTAARRDADRLLEGGCDALLVENMHDAPYLRGAVGPETVAAMAIVVHALVELGAPVGVQVLAAANKEALGVAVAAGASFVRVEGFAYAHVADEGWIEACAGELLRSRRALGADVQIWADVQKKHAAHAVTADLSVEELAHGAAFCGADALVITGSRTGATTSVEHVRAARTAGLPVVVGSGVSPDDAGRLGAEAQALVVGSWLKEGGQWRRPVDLHRVRLLRAALDAGR
jgi:membrane complex biogenesis BtpA family protein